MLFYEHIELQNNEHIKKILLNIAIEEMHHLDILGTILVKLGEKALYRSSDNKEWNSNYVKYNICNLKEMIELNIKSENIAIKEYQKLMNYTRNIYLKRIYERIILDETNHLKVFQKIVKEIK